MDRVSPRFTLVGALLPVLLMVAFAKALRFDPRDIRDIRDIRDLGGTVISPIVVTLTPNTGPAGLAKNR